MGDEIAAPNDITANNLITVFTGLIWLLVCFMAKVSRCGNRPALTVIAGEGLERDTIARFYFHCRGECKFSGLRHEAVTAVSKLVNLPKLVVRAGEGCGRRHFTAGRQSIFAGALVILYKPPPAGAMFHF